MLLQTAFLFVYSRGVPLRSPSEWGWTAPLRLAVALGVGLDRA
jgi:hypothetical protein